MPVNSQHHICRTGAFYDIATALSTYKLYFLTKEMVGPFICLVFQKVRFAILWFLLSCWYKRQSSISSSRRLSSNISHSKPNSNTKVQKYNSQFRSTAYLILNTVTIIMLVLLSGDIHLNPGPSSNQKTTSTISIIHINANRIKNKLSQIELKTKDIDIITISETWLTQDIPDDNMMIKGFHKTIRKDRDGEGGGVAIYVREKSYS